MLDFLAEYVEEHFAEEERYMTLHNYPDRDYHCHQHRELIQEISTIRHKLAEKGPSASMVMALTHSLIHWLVSHVKHVDVKLGQFLGERAA